MLANDAQAGMSRDGSMSPQQHHHKLQRCSEAGRALGSSGAGPRALALPTCLERVSHAAQAAGHSENSQRTMQPCMRMRLRQPQRRFAMGVLLKVAMLLQLVLLLQPDACQAQLQQQGEVIDTGYNILNQPFPTGVPRALCACYRGQQHGTMGMHPWVMIMQAAIVPVVVQGNMHGVCMRAEQHTGS